MPDLHVFDRPTARDFEIVDDISRREFIIGGLSLTAFLAACGGDDGGSSGSTTAAPTGTRTVVGSRGPVEVPAAPARVAALVGSADIDVMLLGLTPVFSGTFAAGWVDLPASVVTSDLVPPDPEVVAAATPDLLIGWDWLVDDAAWEQLGKIAPAITLPDTGSWRDNFRLVAEAVDRAAEADAALADFDAKVAALKARFDAAEPKRVSMIGVFEPGTFWWWDAAYPTNAHLTSIGLEVVSPAETQRDASIERLAELTADWLIVTAAPDDPTASGLLDSPLWQTLPAVRAGQVLVVDRELWGGAGLMWANALLDDVDRLFPA
jgi:iron complex transport system substrate-binding protein